MKKEYTRGRPPTGVVVEESLAKTVRLPASLWNHVKKQKPNGNMYVRKLIEADIAKGEA